MKSRQEKKIDNMEKTTTGDEQKVFFYRCRETNLSKSFAHKA
jgi:hypothetical protein